MYSSLMTGSVDLPKGKNASSSQVNRTLTIISAILGVCTLILILTSSGFTKHLHLLAVSYIISTVWILIISPKLKKKIK